VSSSSRRFKRQAPPSPTPDWFPRLKAQLDRYGVETTSSASDAKRPPPEPQQCSAEYGALVDALMARDRSYFEAHPEETEYIRPAEPGDAPEHAVLDPSQQWRVRVTNIAEGIRTRYIFGVPFLPSEREPERN
jgi:hypothetical protein